MGVWDKEDRNRWEAGTKNRLGDRVRESGKNTGSIVAARQGFF